MPDSKPSQYFGWVPTVTGRLSFSHFGSCEDHNTRHVNRADDRRRYLLVYQTRNASDVLLPFRRHLSERLLGIKGDLQFVCLAVTQDEPGDAQARLDGHIYIIDRTGEWRDQVREPMRSARSKLRDYSFSTETPSIELHFENNFSDALELCSQNCLFQGRFSLKRNGIVTISVDHDMQTASSAPKMPENGSKARHVRHILAAQLFYFLRDVGHRHRHHAAGTDTIVDLHEADETDDVSWRRRTLYNIYRRIISNKRTNNVEAHFRSLGLLAYAKAFKHICDEELEGDDELPVFYDDALEESVRASELDMESKSRTREQQIGNARNYILSAFGFLFTTIGLLELASPEATSDFEPDWILVFIAQFVVEQPIVLFLITAAAIYILGKWDLRLASGVLIRRLRDLQNFLSPTHKYFAVSIFIGVGLIFTTVPILWWILSQLS